MENTTHSLTVEDCKKVSATSIESVDAFTSSQIILSYAGGRIVVAGSGLKIVGFSKSGGNFTATGTVTGIKYSPKGVRITQRLFK